MSLTHYFLDFAYTFTNCINCFPTPSLHINNRSYKIQRLLGEGGFSYVYLVQASNGEYFALKKIRCPFGAESLQHAMKEIDSYKIFNDEHIINIIDSNVVQERDGSKTVYILLPYFRRGNLQDTINANLINHSRYDEREALQLFLEIARGVRVMHKHRVGPGSGLNTRHAGNSTLDFERESQPLMDDEGVTPATSMSNLSPSEAAILPYAHRDIKPGNIMLSQTGVPVLMDLGSCTQARIDVTSRQQAVELQDYAAEYCTISYRAPELFDVKTNSVLDEGVDIWSLGCTYFALLYCSSPFELQSSESGASLSLAIINGQYRFPDAKYSERTKDVIRACLTVEPANRPDIDKVIAMIQGALQQFS
ncbi:kinase-like domain-containing protein [Lipomyces tetrasporus]|uniref:non-specific serine/threonine protein kinase n=1 Tax=Lipomyces tetrasporus TaxID=54092 RepID=A0AAD7VV27_9ASCO|nr:kinase-like domain-containing protein [Lipomyces tetrasporus]KAJ8102519.1 kinase-like domain-containing protein [Lipomyces tetrasporus]